MSLDWDNIFEKIHQFYFFWKQDFVNLTNNSGLTCFSIKDLFLKCEENFLIIFTQKKIFVICKPSFEKFNLKTSFQKIPKIEVVTIKNFSKKIQENSIIDINFPLKSKISLGKNFSFYKESLENFSLFEFWKKNFYMENMFPLLKKFERKNYQGSFFLIIKLNFYIISVVKNFFFQK